MPPSWTSRTRTRLALGLCALLTATACGTSGAQLPGEIDPSQDVLSKVSRVDAIAAQLPAAVRASGRIKVATAAKGSAPVRYYTEDTKELVGVEIDLQKAVGKVLGVRMESEDATFDQIIPAIRSGRYDIGQGNFGVTEERKKQADFVTYYDDGFGFLVRAQRKQPPVREVSDLCGLRVGTNAGTSFEELLHNNASKCAAKGKDSYRVSVYRGTADSMLALSQNKMDVLVLSSVFLQYAAERQPHRLTYVNKIYNEHIGFLLKAGSPLTKPLQLATQELMESGVYQQIMKKWGLESAMIDRSLVNPPGLK
ncbi:MULTISPECIES: ABC transporter substrate-binding protein [Streptomyces]|uniref:ABC transporter substrate-binding protein n=1 Tax=Streptomyces cremeus TaxID=66881 RepID=A0ABV5PJJ6_STRCM